MHHLPARALRAAVAAALLAAAIFTAALPASAADPAYKVLVFSKTAGFRHDSIPDGIAAIQALGAANNFTVDATEDAGAFTTGNLAQYKAVVWLSTTSDVLDDTQQAAFQGYVQAGGGYVGVHAAADTEYDWAWYGGLVGTYFNSHPSIQQATVKVEDRAHPSTAHLGATWTRTDEWYNYAPNPRAQVHVLATLDESSYSGGNMGADHPTAWCHAYDGGRAWYTGGGHTKESYGEAAFTQHLLGGIRWAAGVAAGDCGLPGSGGGTFEAESFTSSSGVQAVGHNGAHGGSTVGYIDNGDWIGFAGTDLNGVTGLTARISSGGAGGTIEVHAGSATGPLLGTATVPVTGGWETFQNVTATLTGSGTSGLFLVFKGGSGALFDVDDVTLTRGGVGGSTTTTQAEAYGNQNGIQLADHAAAHGGRTVGYVNNGDWVSFDAVNLANVTALSARVSSGGAGGTLEVRAASATGPLLGSATVPVTGGWDTFQDVSTSLSASGATTLYLVFTGGSGFLFDLDDFTITRS